MEDTTKVSHKGTLRKQITFDLSDKKLKLYYPKPSFTINPKYHNKAWKDISKFMKENGFEHRQRSVYTSYVPMTRAEILALIDKMVQTMPWLDKCLNAIDVTNVGRQHNLLQAVHGATIKYEVQHSEKTEEKQDSEKSEKKQISIEDLGKLIEERREKNEQTVTSPSKQKGEKNNDLSR